MKKDLTILEMLEELTFLNLHGSQDAVKDVIGTNDLHIRLTDLPANTLASLIVAIIEARAF